MSFDELSWAQIQNPNSMSASSSFSECKLESLLDTRSLEQTWSFLDLPASTTAVDEDPTQSKTAVQMEQAQCRHLYRELTLQKQVGEGAVFQVGLYLHRDGREFAVKHARLGSRRRDGGNNPAGGIFSAMREIQVNFHDTLKRHQNIIDIMGWDWSEKRVPVIITEYAGNGTMRDFLQAPSSFPKGFDLKRNLALDVASGLCALHASDIAHGDVKLENTLVFPHSEQGWCAKVSDFSHAVFGVSSKRKSTYPGSGLYNAPEIRRRDAVITSDLLPSCETFSYGLFVWELLKDGQCFFDTGWICNSNTSNPSNSSMDVMSRIACLERLPPNTLLNRALAFLGGCSSLTRYGRSMFALIFEHTLKDRGTRRSDMSIIASMLDQEDR
jgi:serine/threonine protein kinase